MSVPANIPADPRGGRRRAAGAARATGCAFAGLLLAVIAAMHVAAFGILAALVAPHHYTVGNQVFGVGLGVTAYTLGMRHAFDADHIAAIDNTTRKLMADGKRPVSVGFWFALGHSTIVVVLAGGDRRRRPARRHPDRRRSGAHQTLGVVGTSASGGFLYLIGILNLVALVGIVKVYQAMRRGEFDETALSEHLDNARIHQPASWAG